VELAGSQLAENPAVEDIAELIYLVFKGDLAITMIW